MICRCGHDQVLHSRPEPNAGRGACLAWKSSRYLMQCNCVEYDEVPSEECA